MKKNIWTQIILNKWKKHNNNFIVQIKNITNRSSAQEFINKEIMINKYQLPELKNDEYYWNDIISCRIFDINNLYIGTVIDLMRVKTNDIMIVENKFKCSKKIIFIPFIEKIIVKKIYIKNQLIIVTWNKKNIL